MMTKTKLASNAAQPRPQLGVHWRQTVETVYPAKDASSDVDDYDIKLALDCKPQLSLQQFHSHVETLQKCTFHRVIDLPVERYGQQTEKTNDQLKMNPVVDQVSKQCKETHSNRPVIADDYSSERSISGSKQLTCYHETWHHYSLKTNQDNTVRYEAKNSD